MSVESPRWMVGALLLCAAIGASAAPKVYRCGPDGRTYQQAPCADGKAVDAADPRTPDQRRAAQDVASSEAKAAAKFDRDSQPASAPKAGKASATAPAASEAKSATAKKPAEPDKPTVYLAPAKPKPASAPQ